MSPSLNHFAGEKMLGDLTNASSGDGPEIDDIDRSSIGSNRNYDVPGEQARIESGPDVGEQHKPFEVRIDMPAEQHKSFGEASKSVVDRINEGGLGSLISTFSDVAGPPWLRTAMYAAGLVAYVSTAAGYGMRAYNENLSRILSKVGALAVSALVIASLTMPLPSVWAWIVGLAAWLITVISVLSN